MPKEVFGAATSSWTARSCSRSRRSSASSRAFVAHGVEKVRITGGEPLLRRDLEHLIARLAAIDALDLTLTTNGALLAPEGAGARGRRAARVTVSLDSIDDDDLPAMNDVDFPVDRVLAGIEPRPRPGCR